MKMRRVFVVFFLFLSLLFTSVTAFSHSGRTDASGGHRDNKNKSGLGYYHYHCGGYPAHLHKNGVCPYTSPKSTTTKSSTKKTTTSSVPIKVKVNNKEIKMPTAPINKNGRTLVPMRAIFEELGVIVNWNPDTKIITGTIGDKTITINNNEAVIKNGHTLVPVRFVAESLGAIVDWNNATQTVIIQK